MSAARTTCVHLGFGAGSAVATPGRQGGAGEGGRPAGAVWEEVLVSVSSLRAYGFPSLLVSRAGPSVALSLSVFLNISEKIFL